MFSGVNWLDRMEKYWGWLSFPGLLKGYAFLHVVVFVLQFMNREIGAVLEFDRAKIFSGEVWRAVTFLFADSGSGIPGALGALFFVFMIMIALMMSDALEEVWGVFRTSIYCYAGVLCLMTANFIFGPLIPGSGMLFYSSVFFAFATLYPRMEFRLLFFLPVQVRWIAAVSGVLMLVSAVSAPVLFPYLLMAHLHYILMAGIPALRRKLPRKPVMPVFNKRGAEAAFHHCEVCGETEISSPETHFRVAEDGREYCEDHAPGAGR